MRDTSQINKGYLANIIIWRKMYILWRTHTWCNTNCNIPVENHLIQRIPRYNEEIIKVIIDEDILRDKKQ